ncbi:MAG: DUF2059 domain-containing protein [Kordiimonadaceae bacterium]|nr:DUF2059 domain-containing protein [Kordiimonadaceae bacterium]
MTPLKSLLIAIMVFITLPAQADEMADEAADAAAAKLLDILDVEKTMNQSMEQMLMMQVQANPALVQFSDILIKFTNQYMSYESLKPEFIRIYTEAFSADELNDMIEFYQSPTGQNVKNKIPELMQKGGEIGFQRLNDHSEELKALITERAEKIAADQKAAEDAAAENDAAAPEAEPDQ